MLPAPHHPPKDSTAHNNLPHYAEEVTTSSSNSVCRLQRMEIMAVARGRWRRRFGPTSVTIMSKLQNLTQQNQAKSHTAPHDATANHPDWILQSLSASLTSDALRFGLRYEQMGYHHRRVFIVTCFVGSASLQFSVSTPQPLNSLNLTVSSLLFSCLSCIYFLVLSLISQKASLRLISLSSRLNNLASPDLN